MFVLHVMLQMVPVLKYNVTFRTGELTAIRGFMSFPAMCSIITNSSLDMVTNWSWGFMFFPAMFTIITGSSFEMVTNCSCFLMSVGVCGEVYDRGGRGVGGDGRGVGRDGRGVGRVDGRVG